MNAKIKRCLIDIMLFILLIALDRITKIWAASRLMNKDAIPLIPGVLELYYLPNGNTGAAFGLLMGHRTLFLLIAAVVVAAIVYIIWNMPNNKKYKSMEILMVFIAAGGVGNMIDRLMQGYVVDFIYISLINFPIFNVADMYVSVCTVILAIFMLFKLKEEDYNYLESSLKAPFSKNKDKNHET